MKPRTLVWILGSLWALPMTSAGLFVALFVLLDRGRVHGIRGGAVEFVARAGGLFARAFFVPFGVSAFTWGQVIIGRNAPLLDDPEIHRHERVHVRQAMQLGPFFPICYLTAGLLAWLAGGRWYWDNVFEAAARGEL